ncbi:MAG TPA: response regulator transcription factor [Candidatus Limnocylindrales bacterium]|nr:response regulator transcription factor [Candidatus Limnocylindrales bacterium]
MARVGVNQERRQSRSVLTPREREIADLIGRGMTNRGIASTLDITERTASSHVQNILNKLGLDNRTQVATWWAHASDLPTAEVSRPVTSASPATASAVRTPSYGRPVLIAACGVAMLLIFATDGELPLAAQGANVVNVQPAVRDQLFFQATMDGQGLEFGPAPIVGDQNASRVRFLKGAVEFSVLKPGGLTGTSPAMHSLPRYFAEIGISVTKGSLVSFWFSLTQPDSYKNIGSYLVGVNTYDEYLQLGYFIQDQDVLWLSRPVPIAGLQAGRSFRVAALVDPPRFAVYLDGNSVIDTRHTPNTPLQTPTFQIFGDGTGTVTMTSLTIYTLK